MNAKTIQENQTKDKSRTSKEPLPENQRPVEIEAIRAIAPASLGGKIINPGTKVMVSEEDAKEFCDKKFEGYSQEGFGGTATRPFPKDHIVRAKRVQKKSENVG
jgi:hypothetical protein